MSGDLMLQKLPNDNVFLQGSICVDNHRQVGMNALWVDLHLNINILSLFIDLTDSFIFFFDKSFFSLFILTI